MPFRAIKLVLLTLLSLLFFQVTGQIPEILTVTEYKRGIYKNYAEFLTNSPSITDRFIVETRSSEKAIEREKAAYRLILVDSVVRKRDLKEIWGFSDGQSIYANEVAISGSIVFRKFNGLGRYCYLQASPPNTTMYTPGLIGGLVGAAVYNAAKGQDPYILNVNNGKFFPLNKQVLMTILQKDRQLLAEYETAERKQKDLTLIDFIDRYNERHRDEADASLWFDRKMLMYRFARKELEGTVTITINDTLSFTLAPGQADTLRIRGDRVKVCSTTGLCQTILLHRKGLTYVGISQRKKDDVSIRPTKRDEAEFFLKKRE